jgi:dTDP-L-rhamnose 4-epimerase
MQKRILITGGAGFIGSHLADELIEHGYAVRILDNLLPQVHGETRDRPEYLNAGAEFIYGDVRQSETVCAALAGVDAVVHFAAAVGVGQSMYEIKKYTDINALGTSVLLEALLERPIERLIIASSMSIYGEGMYRSATGHLIDNARRSLKHLKASQWELCDGQGNPLNPVATPETKPPEIASVYALSKYVQERMCLMIGQTYRIPTVALRFFNVYGTRQSLSNPYTGVLAIFASRFLNEKSPMLFEDGYQRRDFVSVLDVAHACRLALESECHGEVFNIGSGASYSIVQIADLMAEVLNKKHLRPQISGKYRVGDIRHCFADISKAQSMLGFQPRITLEKGIEDFARWLEGRNAQDYVDSVNAELTMRGLTM